MAAINSVEYLREVILNQSYDYRGADLRQLRILTEAQRELLWNKLNDYVDIRWDEVDEQERMYTYSVQCWRPIDSTTEMPKVAIYPWSGMRKLDASIRKFFLAEYMEYDDGFRGYKTINLCGNSLCCNPSHQLLVPQKLKTALDEIHVDILDDAKSVLKFQIVNTRKQIDIVEIVRAIEQKLTEKGIIDEVCLLKQDRIDKVFVTYHVGEMARKMIRRLISSQMKGLKFDSARLRDEEEISRYQRVVEACGYQENKISKEESDENYRAMLKKAREMPANTEVPEEPWKLNSSVVPVMSCRLSADNKEGIGKPRLGSNPLENVDAWDLLAESKQQSNFCPETSGEDEEEALEKLETRELIDNSGIVNNEEEEDNTIEYNGTTLDKMDDSELRQQLIEAGMSEEEVDAMLHASEEER